MPEYIEREKVIEVIKNYGKGAIEDGKKSLDPVDDIILLARAMDFIPTADVQEVKHGEWVHIEENEYQCSECKESFEFNYGMHPIIDLGMYYCLNCGAKMDKE